MDILAASISWLLWLGQQWNVNGGVYLQRAIESIGYMAKSVIGRWYGGSIYSFVMEAHTEFHIACAGWTHACSELEYPVP